jgi:hypothetical protein
MTDAEACPDLSYLYALLDKYSEQLDVDVDEQMLAAAAAGDAAGVASALAAGASVHATTSGCPVYVWQATACTHTLQHRHVLYVRQLFLCLHVICSNTTLAAAVTQLLNLA